MCSPLPYVNIFNSWYQLCTYCISISAAMQEDEETTQLFVNPSPKKCPSSSWLCCCFSSFVGPTGLYSSRADNTILVPEPWYHSKISKKEAVKRLAAQKFDCFLVRKSQHQAGKYKLSVNYGRVIKHHTIREKNQLYEVEGTEQSFSTLSELVAYFKNHYISTDQELLVNACPRPTLRPRKKVTPPGMSKKDLLLHAALICNGM